VATLSHFDGSKLETAKALGISLKTLYNRLQEYRNTTS
jgi:DNA-binding NtrC family response regulator